MHPVSKLTDFWFPGMSSKIPNVGTHCLMISVALYSRASRLYETANPNRKRTSPNPCIASTETEWGYANTPRHLQTIFVSIRIDLTVAHQRLGQHIFKRIKQVVG